MIVPSEYVGRESTFLKHRVLSEYLEAWAHKLASRSRFGATRLWYVDCFAGPWHEKNQDLRDTSVHLDLEALREAASTWRDKGHSVQLGAIFVEKSAASFAALETYLKQHGEGIQVVPFNCEFGAAVERIDRKIGSDPAFLFVDPTGWKGAAMKYIAPLVTRPHRDVLINVMFNYINRFKDDPRSFLREQIRDFFGLEERDLPPGLDETGLFELYRRQLREKCGVKYACDLAIPHPTHDRTWFRLVVGGNHPSIVELFRTIERKVCGTEARGVRDEAKHRGERQMNLGLSVEEPDRSYGRLRREGRRAVPEDVLRCLQARSPQTYADLWPTILSDHHITKPDLNEIVWDMHKKKLLLLRNLSPKQRTAKDENVLVLVPG